MTVSQSVPYSPWELSLSAEGKTVMTFTGVQKPGENTMLLVVIPYFTYFPTIYFLQPGIQFKKGKN